ncbi:TPA: excinuclease ABC subunit C [Patescibacteria group bacterium]|nr:excinuclease ABC subunit C [Patescibacteria group bacterium]
MHYVYILKSKKDNSKYIGMTCDLKSRLQEHNNGETKSNKSKIPYVLEWYCCFNNKSRALSFEKYLKSSSGHAFRNKRLLSTEQK